MRKTQKVIAEKAFNSIKREINIEDKQRKYNMWIAVVPRVENRLREQNK